MPHQNRQCYLRYSITSSNASVAKSMYRTSQQLCLTGKIPGPAGFPTLNGIQVQLDFWLSFGNCFYYFLRCRAFVSVYFLVLSQSRKFLESNPFMFFLQGELHCQVSGITAHSQVFSFFIFLLKSLVLFELFLAPCA